MLCLKRRNVLTGRIRRVDVHLDHVLVDRWRAAPRLIGSALGIVGGRRLRWRRTSVAGRLCRGFLVVTGTATDGWRRPFRFDALRRGWHRLASATTLVAVYVLVFAVVVVRRPLLAQVQSFALFRHNCSHRHRLSLVRGRQVERRGRRVSSRRRRRCSSRRTGRQACENRNRTSC